MLKNVVEWIVRYFGELTTITPSNNQSVVRLNQGGPSFVVARDDNVLSLLKKGTLSKMAKLYIPKLGLPGAASIRRKSGLTWSIIAC